MPMWSTLSIAIVLAIVISLWLGALYGLLPPASRARARGRGAGGSASRLWPRQSLKAAGLPCIMTEPLGAVWRWDTDDLPDKDYPIGEQW